MITILSVRRVYQYLKRLLDAGRVGKAGRGLYIPVSEPSGVSEPQVSGVAESDTPLPGV